MRLPSHPRGARQRAPEMGSFQSIYGARSPSLEEGNENHSGHRASGLRPFLESSSNPSCGQRTLCVLDTQRGRAKPEMRSAPVNSVLTDFFFWFVRK